MITLSLLIDVFKLNDVGDRVLIEGFFGELIDIIFVEDWLKIKGLKGELKINLKEKEIQKFYNTKELEIGDFSYEKRFGN